MTRRLGLLLDIMSMFSAILYHCNCNCKLCIDQMIRPYQYALVDCCKQIFELTHLSLASFLSYIGKQYSPRCDAAQRDVPSGAIIFA